MNWLLTDQPSVLAEGMLLLGTALAVALASTTRTRSTRSENPVVAVFWTDASHAAWAWAAAAGSTLAGSIARVEGLSSPIWPLLELGVAAVLPLLLRRRWGSEGLAVAARVAATPVGVTPRRVTATTWEIGVLGAAVGGLGVYMLAVAHVWGHPIHWLVAGIGAALGFAVGLAAATPRYSVRSSRAS